MQYKYKIPGNHHFLRICSLNRKQKCRETPCFPGSAACTEGRCSPGTWFPGMQSECPYRLGPLSLRLSTKCNNLLFVSCRCPLHFSSTFKYRIIVNQKCVLNMGKCRLKSQQMPRGLSWTEQVAFKRLIGFLFSLLRIR